MNGLNGDQNGIVHALNPHADTGGHAGEHPLCLRHLDHSGVGAGGRAGAVDLGQRTLKGILADGADGDRNGLTQFQREDVCLVHADGHGHFFVSRKGDDCRGGILRMIHTVNTAIHLRQNSAITLDGQQLQKGLLQLCTLPEKGIVVCAVTGVFQSEQLGGIGYLCVQRGIHLGNGTCVAGDLECAVDVELAGPQLGAFAIAHGDCFIVFGAVVGHKDGGLAAHNGFHGARDLLFVGQLHGNTVACAERIGLDVHRHVAVQRD